MRYAVAYKRFEDDPMVFFEGNPICMFCQGIEEVEKLKQYYLTYIPEKETTEATYSALEKAIEKVIGKKVRLHFTHAQPTVWKECKCPSKYHDMFVECRSYK